MEKVEKSNQIHCLHCVGSVSKSNVYHLYTMAFKLQWEKCHFFSLVFCAHFNFVYRFPFRLWHCTVLEMCVWFLFIVWRTRFSSIDWILIDCHCCLHANVLTIKHTCFFIVVLFLETERACVHVMSIAKQQTEQVNVEMYGKRKQRKNAHIIRVSVICVCVCKFLCMVFGGNVTNPVSNFILKIPWKRTIPTPISDHFSTFDCNYISYFLSRFCPECCSITSSTLLSDICFTHFLPFFLIKFPIHDS